MTAALPGIDGESAADPLACTVAGVMAQTPSGATVPITECVWLQVAPCGCVNGVTSVQWADDDILLTAAAAMKRMAEDSAAEAKRDAKAGFRMVLITRDDYRDSLPKAALISCPHVPRYGYVPPQRTVAGVTWSRRSENEWYIDTDAGKWTLHRIDRRSSWYLRTPHTAKDSWGGYIHGSAVTDAMRAAASVVDQQERAS